MNVEIHWPIYERAIFPRKKHTLKTKCSGKYMDLSVAQQLNIIETFVVYGLFERQLWSNKITLKQAAHKMVCVRVRVCRACQHEYL